MLHENFAGNIVIRLALLISLVVLTGCTNMQDQETDLTGSWMGGMRCGPSNYAIELLLSQKGKEITGKLTLERMDTYSVFGVVSGNRFSFKATGGREFNGIDFSGTANQKGFSGGVKLNLQGVDLDCELTAK